MIHTADRLPLHAVAPHITIPLLIVSEETPNNQPPQRHNRVLPWILLGPPVTFTGVVSYFLYFAQFPELRDTPWLNIPFALFGVGLSGVGIWRSFQVAGWIKRILAGGGAFCSVAFTGLFLAYVFHLSFEIPGESQVTAELEAIPTFQAVDQNGTTVDSTQLRGKNLVLAFYRGHW